MSYHNYLVSENNKILIDLGNHVNREEWMNDVEEFKDLIKYLDTEYDFEMIDKTYNKFTAKEFGKLINIFDKVGILCDSGRGTLLGIVASLYVEDTKKVNIIGEEDTGKYTSKGYRILSTEI